MVVIERNMKRYSTDLTDGTLRGLRRYFGVDRIDCDQVEDYARRKDTELAEAERWLDPQPRLRAVLKGTAAGGRCNPYLRSAAYRRGKFGRSGP